MMGAAYMLGVAVKTSLLAAAVLVALRLTRGRSHSERAWLAGSGLLLCLILAPIIAISPKLAAPLPDVMERLGWLRAIAANAGPAPAVIDAVPGLLWNLVAIAYVVPVVAGLGATALGLIRLWKITRRAAEVEVPAWRTALTVLTRRCAIRRPLSLVVSHEIASPLSWGLWRAHILIDPATLSKPELAEAVLAHELAHVARFDWPMLMAGRCVASLHWFNPLVLRLVRAQSRLSELAADDFALRLGQRATDYAQALVDLAGRTLGRPMPVANGAAALRSLLGARIESALHPVRPRNGTEPLFVCLSCLALSGLSLPLVGLSATSGRIQAPSIRRTVQAVRHDRAPGGLADPTPWDDTIRMGETWARFDPTQWDWAVSARGSRRDHDPPPSDS